MLSKRFRIGLLVFVLAVVISGVIIGSFVFCLDLSWDIGPYFVVGSVFSTINVLMSTILLIPYIRSYIIMKTEFNLMLVIIAFAMLCYSIVANPLIRTALGYGGSGLGPFFILPDLFTFGTLISLLYLSLKY